MNKTQLSRWNAAKKLFEKLISTAEITHTEIWFDGTFIKPNDIIITEEGITIKIWDSYHCQFSTNQNFDDGLYTRKADYAKIVKAKFRLVKYVRW